MKLPDVRIQKILYATDLSESAVHAFAYAVNLANTYGAGITILHVMAEFPGENFILNMIHTDTWKEIKRRHYTEAREELISKKRDHYAIKDVLRAFSEAIQNRTPDQMFVTDDILIKSGPPAEMIVETAKKHQCDLIVMGTHGQSALAEVLIGSTARWVTRHSPIPVLVVRLPE
jgi:nucleotide-binding universal stress UspA family protein